VDQTGTPSEGYAAPQKERLTCRLSEAGGVRLIKVGGTARDKQVSPNKISVQTFGESCSLSRR